jgi:hypothetical protein
MNPTLLRKDGFRYFFFSREEARMHVHVSSGDGEAKFWLEPTVSLAWQAGLRPHQLSGLQQTVEENQDDFRNRWTQHFRS